MLINQATGGGGKQRPPDPVKAKAPAKKKPKK